jgi:hypothetical protein
MKKLILVTSLLLMTTMLLTGCGENKKKAEILGLSSAPVVASALDTQLASSADALYSMTKAGTDVGAVSVGVRRHSFVGTDMEGLGSADAEGYYTLTNTGVTGMVCKIRFKNGSDPVYFNMENILGTGLDDPQLYTDQDLTAAKTALSLVPHDATAFAIGWPRYVPSMFCKVSDNKPLDWFEITSPTDLGTDPNLATLFETNFNNWISSHFPDSMENTVTGTIAAGTLALSLTSTMTDKPTDANPAHLAGTGTLTMDSGDVMTITSAVDVGASGPVGGTQSFTSTGGMSGTMTFHSDKTMTGVISKDGAVIATISVAADGTGTLTDLTTGAVSTI